MIFPGVIFLCAIICWWSNHDHQYIMD